MKRILIRTLDAVGEVEIICEDVSTNTHQGLPVAIYGPQVAQGKAGPAPTAAYVWPAPGMVMDVYDIDDTPVPAPAPADRIASEEITMAPGCYENRLEYGRLKCMDPTCRNCYGAYALAQETADKLTDEDRAYICPQCGPDPRGSELHAEFVHTWPIR